MSDVIPKDEEFIAIWCKPQLDYGVDVADTFQEIQAFAYNAFEVMDQDGDGFISRTELNHFLNLKATSLRAKSFIRFLLLRLDDIKKAYIEDVKPDTDGISRQDLKLYFDNLTPSG